ncbi:GpE family phage tail protein [Novosphingobium sp. TCA1]|jgi:hypothetical protein|nr:GpE family phage tail protein [Novosphingobium sp. TCA1]
MADIASVFSWPPSEMDGWPIAELMIWRAKAEKRAGSADTSPKRGKR